MAFQRFAGQIKNEVVAVRAERDLKKVAAGICQSMTPEHLRALARNEISLLSILQDAGRKIPTPSANAKAGVDYLTGLSTSRLLEILDEVVPEHVAVLREFPGYADSIARDLKAIAAGNPLTKQ